MKRFLALTILLCVAGCSPQKNLAQRLKEADRVVVTPLPARGRSATVTGAELDKIIQAISTAKKQIPLVDASVDLRLEFFKGGSLLETVAASAPIFGVGQEQYKDQTGTLKALYERF